MTGHPHSEVSLLVSTGVCIYFYLFSSVILFGNFLFEKWCINAVNTFWISLIYQAILGSCLLPTRRELSEKWCPGPDKRHPNLFLKVPPGESWWWGWKMGSPLSWPVRRCDGKSAFTLFPLKEESTGDFAAFQLYFTHKSYMYMKGTRKFFPQYQNSSL